MKNTFVRKPFPLVTLLGLTLPALGDADCIPTAPVSWDVPFEMVSLKSFSSGGNSCVKTGTLEPQWCAWASYASGTLQYTPHSLLFRGTTVATSPNKGIPQLFSNRTFDIHCTSSPGGFSTCEQQPFNIDNADQLGISIFDGYDIRFPRPASIGVTFTLESWGNGQIDLTGTCDPTSGELYLTSNTGMYVMTFGTPYNPVIP
jgi:hypothetical protein